MNSVTLRPDRNGLVFKPILLITSLGLPFVLAGAVLLPILSFVAAGILCSVDVFLYLWFRKIYHKTKYELTEKKIRVRTGTYFSDSEQELLWSKVVQAKIDQGFLQWLLFGTGNVLLQAAGQSRVEIVLKELGDPEDGFEQVLRRWNREHSLPDDSVQDTYHPSTKGISLDVAVPTVLTTTLVAGMSFGAYEYVRLPFPWVRIALPAVVFLLCLSGFMVWALVQWNTSYERYDRYVVRIVNFLGRERTVIPLSMLSDVNLRYPPHKRILGIGHLELSVPGLGDTVTLQNLTGNASLRKILQNRSDELKGVRKKTETLPAEKRFEARPHFLSSMALPLLAIGFYTMAISGVYVLFDVSSGKFFEAVVTVSLLAIPGLVCGVYGIHRFVRFVGSSYAVEGNRVEDTFTFLHKSITSLSTDKIKAIVKRQGILERWFQTYTVEFHSIGTDQNVQFSSIPDTPKNEEMLQHIRRHEGSFGGEQVDVVRPSFTVSGIVFQQPYLLAFPVGVFVGSWFLGAVLLPGLLFTSILMGSFAALGTLFGLLAYLTFYFSNCVSLNLYPGYLIYQEGYFQTRTFYVVYEDVRNVEYARQPFGSRGWLRIDYAGGDRRPQTHSRPGTIHSLLRGLRKEGSFSFLYMAEVETTSNALEDVFSREVEPSDFAPRTEKDVSESEAVHLKTSPIKLPYIVQGLFYGLLINFVLLDVFPAVLSLPVTGGIIFLAGVLGAVYPSLMTYTVKDHQVEWRYWLFLTRTKSIRYKNVDNIEADRGFFDKLLGTGKVKVSTTGGSGVEIGARFLPDHERFYEILCREYDEEQTTNVI